MNTFLKYGAYFFRENINRTSICILDHEFPYNSLVVYRTKQKTENRAFVCENVRVACLFG